MENNWEELLCVNSRLDGAFFSNIIIAQALKNKNKLNLHTGSLPALYLDTH